MYLRIKLIDQNSEWDLSMVRATIAFEGQNLELDNSANTERVPLNTTPATGAAVTTTISSSGSDFDGRDVAVGIETGDYIRIQIPFEDFVEQGTIRLTFYHATDDELIYFDGSFAVFNYDLGNNDDLSINDNPPFIILMREDPEGADIDLVAANLISYRKPYTNEIYFYNASNSEGDRTYYLIDSAGTSTVIGNTGGFTCHSDVASIRQEISLRRYQATGSCGGMTLLPGFPVEDTSTQIYNGTVIFSDAANYDRTSIRNLLLNNYIWVPPANLYISCSNPNQADCVVLGNQAFAALNVDTSNLPVLRVEDVLTHPYSQLVINYRVININGVVEDTRNVIETITYPYNFAVNSSTNIEFVPDTFGDYVVDVDYTFRSGTEEVVECEVSRKILSSHWFRRTQVECNQHRIDNLSFDSITVQVNRLNDDRVFESAADPITIIALGTQDISLSGSGIFEIVVTRGSDTIRQIVDNYCGLQSCLENIIIDFLCKDLVKCTTPDYYNVVSIIAVAYTHFMLLNEEYQFNYIYESISPSKLEDLFTIRTTLDRALSYCNACTSGNNTNNAGMVTNNSFTATNSSSCGCS